jgi:hypothetical protein
MLSLCIRVILSTLVLCGILASSNAQAQSATAGGKCGGTIQIEVTEKCTQCSSYKAEYPTCPTTKQANLGGSCNVNICVKYVPPKTNGSCLQGGQWYVPCCVPASGQPSQGPGCLDRLTCCNGCKCGCSKWTKGNSPTSNGWGCFAPTSYDPTKVNASGLADCECSKACTMDPKICKGTEAPKACQKLACGTGANATNCSIVPDCSQEGCCSRPECASHPGCGQNMCLGKCAYDLKTGKPNCSFECDGGKCCCPPGGEEAAKCKTACPSNPTCNDAGATSTGKQYPSVEFNELLAP